MVEVSMRAIATVLLLSVLPVHVASMYGAESPVQEVTRKTWSSRIANSGSVTVVEFFKDDCLQCKEVKPEIEKAAAALDGVLNVFAYESNSDSAREFSFVQQGVKGYPCIRFYKGKELMDEIQGPSTAEYITTMAMRHAKEMVEDRVKASKKGKGGAKKKPSKVIQVGAGKLDMAEVQAEGDYVLVMFCVPWNGQCKKLMPEWEEAAADIDKDKNLKGQAHLAYVNIEENEEMKEQFAVDSFPAVRVLHKGEVRVYDGDLDTSAIVAFVREDVSRHPPIVPAEITGPAIMQDKCAGLQICLVALVPHILDSGAATRNEYLESLHRIGAAVNKPWGIVWAEAGKQAALEEGLDAGRFGYPSLLAVLPRKKRLAAMAGSFTLDNMQAFVDTVKALTVKTQPFTDLGQVEEAEPWDGGDGEMVEEEFSLDDLDL